MANELNVSHPAVANIYVIIRRISDGYVWIPTSKVWAVWDDSALASYAINLNNYGGGYYAANFPADIENNTQVMTIYYVRSGGAPDLTDLCISRRAMVWSGSILTDIGTDASFLRGYIRAKFGYPVVDVELTDEQIDFCVGDALRNFNAVLCHYDPKIVPNQYQSVQIELDDDAQGVNEVHALVPHDRRIYLGMNMFQLMYHMIFPRVGLSDWYLSRTWLRQLQKSYGTDPDWRVLVNPATGKRTLWVDCFSGPYDIFFMQVKRLTITSMLKVHEQYFQQFLDLAHAKCQIILGRIRGKFGGIPAPSGQLVTDASDLVTQGIAREKELLTWLNGLARYSAIPIVLG